MSSVPFDTIQRDSIISCPGLLGGLTLAALSGKASDQSFDIGIGYGSQNLISLLIAQHGQALAGLLYSLKNLFHFAMVILVLDEAHRSIIIRALASSNTLFSMFSWV